MTAQVIDGRKIAEELKVTVAGEVCALRDMGIPYGLTTIRVGDDFSSAAYQSRLCRIGEELGVPVRKVELPATVTEEELKDVVRQANADDLTAGILILRPLPDTISEAAVFQTLSPIKDIESVHPENAGLLALGVPRYVPSTAAAVFHVLDQWLDGVGEDRADFYHRARIVIVGRSNNVGKPLVSLAYAREAAVESVDEWASRTRRLSAHTRRADVLIAAAGVPALIAAEHVRAGAIVLDVGINPKVDEDSGVTHMVGDVDFDAVINRARAVTPVPGGIGPVTDVWLIRNVALAAQNNAGHGAHAVGVVVGSPK
ncbi:bifunctional 5,10-methylenetetrahydrofolate dehydrogenase/5,10-methenyltetrahydrofolate cyclohydrolase [Mycobacterium sp. BMJ-28]